MRKGKIIFIISICIIIGLIILISYIMLKNNKKIEKNKNIIIEETYADISDAYIYGTHLNIEGKIQVSNNDIEKLTLILVNEEEQLEYDLKYKIEKSNIEFTTCEYINRGINLEEVSKEKYIFLIKISEKTGENKYYSLNVNNINLEELNYYSISNNGMTNHITLKQEKKEEKTYLLLSLKNIKIPENIYDITIDAGHGGEHSGATNNGYKESDIVLKYSIKLKELLEKQGLKVALTREADTTTEEYGENGRAVLPNKVKSKYTFSIHLNSFTKVRSGVEVYAPSKSELSFARLLAKNIVEYANTTYSPNEVDKIYDGVYVRTFTKEDIEKSNKDAKEDGYESYNITIDTPYLFMIRETGAKITNAYVDGRNKEYGINLYYNSSMGNESYLIELGYINSDKDLKNLLKNEEGYLKGIEQSILTLVNKNDNDIKL